MIMEFKGKYMLAHGMPNTTECLNLTIIKSFLNKKFGNYYCH